MSTKKNDSRPTSPHLQIYKMNISTFTSIMHRFTGIILYVSLVAISWYIVYYTYQINVAESSPACDCPTKAILDKIFALASLGVTFALYYHLCNGIRHLFWDIGKGFDKHTARMNGFLVITAATILTAISFGFAFYLKFF